jgi:hypothetical protein
MTTLLALLKVFIFDLTVSDISHHTPVMEPSLDEIVSHTRSDVVESSFQAYHGTHTLARILTH